MAGAVARGVRNEELAGFMAESSQPADFEIRRGEARRGRERRGEDGRGEEGR